MGAGRQQDKTALWHWAEGWLDVRVCRFVGPMDRQSYRSEAGDPHRYYNGAKRGYRSDPQPNAGDSGPEGL
jgi:hypothetical protein